MDKICLYIHFLQPWKSYSTWKSAGTPKAAVRIDILKCRKPCLSTFLRLAVNFHKAGCGRWPKPTVQTLTEISYHCLESLSIGKTPSPIEVFHKNNTR